MSVAKGFGKILTLIAVALLTGSLLAFALRPQAPPIFPKSRLP